MLVRQKVKNPADMYGAIYERIRPSLAPIRPSGTPVLGSSGSGPQTKISQREVLRFGRIIRLGARVSLEYNINTAPYILHTTYYMLQTAC
jgi:hypothetical protein